ncbi:MAG: hypothetical protein CMH57_09050 [Myxococcales bacterium]|nr:hypothetical protein [Myxococcales bacterium]
MVASLMVWATLGLWSTEATALEYTIKYGDSLPKLAKRFYGDSRQWRRIAEANGLETGEFFKVGEVILIPEDGDPENPGAHIAYAEGAVEVLLPPDDKAKPAEVGVPLLWQHGVRTGEGASAELRLKDGALLKLSPETELVVLGARGVRRGRPGGVRIHLKRGAVELSGEVGRPSQLEILTRDGLARLVGSSLLFGIKGGLYEVAAPDGEIAFEENRILRGKGGVTHPAKGSDLNALPKAPRLTLPEGTAVLVSIGRQERPLLSWSKFDGALGRYEARVTSLERRSETQRVEADGEQSHMTLPLSRPGLYEVQVRAIGKAGLPGPWATRRIWHVVLTPTNRYVGRDSSGRPVFVGVGELTFNPGRQDMMVYAGVDQAELELVGVRETMRVEGVGEHKLVLRVLPGDALERKKPLPDVEMSLVIAEISGIEVDFAPLQLDPMKVQEVQVTVRLKDQQGRPVVGEAPIVEAGRRSCEARPTSEPGEYRCALTPRVPPGLETLPLVIKGRGGTFVHQERFMVRLPDEDALRVR